MKKIQAVTAIIFSLIINASAQTPSGLEVLKKVDKNLVLDKAITQTTMIIHGRSGTRTVKSKSWIEGKNKAFVEYTYPPREEGKKMLKLQDHVWIYVPEPTDRVISISGHLLRQPVMGSDLSYEDITENRKMIDIYNAEVTGSEIIDGRDCYIIKLTAKLEDITYYSRKLWVDKERWVPLKEIRYAKSGKPLKRSDMLEVFSIENRWYPKKIHYYDLMKNGEGTEYIIDSITLHAKIAESQFTKAVLKK
ncbi:MAG TPA: outer membrane lipoprotein-sorting protein [Ignavibacteriaceae bacterium]|nr:outer membrane lipoprotein-sorting protein [Ignavibacteriaceae bacterium]